MKQTKDAYARLTQLIKTETYREAAATMNKEGYKTASGKKWNANIIASWVFNNRAKKGHKINNPETKPGKVRTTGLRGFKIPQRSKESIANMAKLKLIREIVMGAN